MLSEIRGTITSESYVDLIKVFPLNFSKKLNLSNEKHIDICEFINACYDTSIDEINKDILEEKEFFILIDYANDNIARVINTLFIDKLGNGEEGIYQNSYVGAVMDLYRLHTYYNSFLEAYLDETTNLDEILKGKIKENCQYFIENDFTSSPYKNLHLKERAKRNYQDILDTVLSSYKKFKSLKEEPTTTIIADKIKTLFISIKKQEEASSIKQEKTYNFFVISNSFLEDVNQNENLSKIFYSFLELKKGIILRPKRVDSDKLIGETIPPSSEDYLGRFHECINNKKQQVNKNQIQLLAKEKQISLQDYRNQIQEEIKMAHDAIKLYSILFQRSIVSQINAQINAQHKAVKTPNQPQVHTQSQQPAIETTQLAQKNKPYISNYEYVRR